MKKIFTSLALVATLIAGAFGFSAEDASASGFTTMGAGTWDNMGTDSFTSTPFTGKTINSGGGDYMVEVSGTYGGLSVGSTTLTATLYEKDTFGSTSLGSKTVWMTSSGFAATGSVQWDVSSYTDGVDGQAELYVVFSNKTGNYNFKATYFD